MVQTINDFKNIKTHVFNTERQIETYRQVCLFIFVNEMIHNLVVFLGILGPTFVTLVQLFIMIVGF